MVRQDALLLMHYNPKFPRAIHFVFYFLALRLVPIGVDIVSSPDPEVGLVCSHSGPGGLGELIAVAGSEGDHFERLIKVVRKLRESGSRDAREQNNKS